MEVAGDRRVRGGVRGREALHGPVREHHAPAEGVVRAIALVHLDPRPRQCLAEQQRGIQAGGAAAQADDAFQTDPPVTADIKDINSLDVK